MFRLVEITYPLSIDTIGKMLAMGNELTVTCHTTGCHHSGRVNLVALGYRIGMDHSCMADDLMRFFYCPKCRESGRKDKNIGFIVGRPGGHSDWPRKVSACAKAKGG